MLLTVKLILLVPRRSSKKLASAKAGIAALAARAAVAVPPDVPMNLSFGPSGTPCSLRSIHSCRRRPGYLTHLLYISRSRSERLPMWRRPVGRLRIGGNGLDGRETPRHVVVFGRISPPRRRPTGRLYIGDLVKGGFARASRIHGAEEKRLPGGRGKPAGEGWTPAGSRSSEQPVGLAGWKVFSARSPRAGQPTFLRERCHLGTVTRGGVISPADRNRRP